MSESLEGLASRIRLEVESWFAENRGAEPLVPEGHSEAVGICIPHEQTEVQLLVESGDYQFLGPIVALRASTLAAMNVPASPSLELFVSDFGLSVPFSRLYCDEAGVQGCVNVIADAEIPLASEGDPGLGVSMPVLDLVVGAGALYGLNLGREIVGKFGGSLLR